jgi:flagellar hook assembly protein FlgD
MENSELVQQISQIREISATNQLTDTLTSVLMGQNTATASSDR